MIGPKLHEKRPKKRQKKMQNDDLEFLNEVTTNQSVWKNLVSLCDGWVLDAVAIDEHRIVIIEYTRTVKMFDIETNTWSVLPCLPRDLEGKLQSVVFQSYLYIIVVDEIHSSIWRLLISELDEWEELRQSNSQRTGCAIAADDEFLYMSGGKYQDNSFFRSQKSLSNFARYNPSTNLWINLPNMRYDRRDHTAVTVKDDIYILGGRCGSDNNLLVSVEVFNTTTQTWNTAPKMASSFQKLCTVVVDSRWIVIVGTRQDHVSACVIFDTRTKSWFQGIPLTQKFICSKILLLGTSQIVFVGQNNDSFFSMNSINFHHLNPWVSVGSIIKLRRLAETKRAFPAEGIGINDKAIQALISYVDDDIFRRVLSFLVYHPKKNQPKYD